VTFLMRDLGRDAMELSGEAITAGLPAQLATFSVAPPFTACAGAFIEPSASFSFATVIISHAAFRAGCPAAGQSVTVLLNNTLVATLPFEPAQAKSATFVIGGDSMRVFTSLADAASIEGRDCAAVVPINGFVPP